MGNPCRIPLAIVLVILTSPFATSAESPFLVLPEGPTKVSISRSGEPYLDLEFLGWGPQWAWMGFEGQFEESGNAARLINREGPRIEFRDIVGSDRTSDPSASPPDSDRLEHDTRYSADLHRGFAGPRRTVVRQEYRTGCTGRWNKAGPPTALG